MLALYDRVGEQNPCFLRNEDCKMAEAEDVSYEAKCKRVSAIASPLADEKLYKRIIKVMRKATKRKSMTRGVKEVVKAVRKNQKG